MARNTPNNGPYSRLLSRGSAKGTSRKGRYLKAFKKMMVDHLGGHAPATQEILIKRLANQSWRLELMDEDDTASFDEGAAKRYIALSNALSRGLRTLGLKDRPAPKPSLEQHLRTNYGATREAQPT